MDWNSLMMLMGAPITQETLTRFSNTVPYRPVNENTGAPKLTNPNAFPGKTGKNAKSKQMREAESAQNELEIIRSIFQPQGPRRLTMSGQPEKDVPQGLDFFKNTGADRPEVQTRKAALDKQSLSNPTTWWQANQAVLDKKRQQGWSDPNTPPVAPTMDLDQFLRTPTKNVDVFTNPAADQVNPRTGLNTNQGAFVRSMPSPYGTARAEFIPQGEASVGAVQELFGQPQNLTPPSPMFNLPVAQPTSLPTMPTMSTNPAASFGVPDIAWSDLVPQENSPPLLDLFQTNPQTGKERFDWTKLFNLFTPGPQPADASRKFYPLGF